MDLMGGAGGVAPYLAVEEAGKHDVGAVAGLAGDLFQGVVANGPGAQYFELALTRGLCGGQRHRLGNRNVCNTACLKPPTLYTNSRQTTPPAMVRCSLWPQPPPV